MDECSACPEAAACCAAAMAAAARLDEVVRVEAEAMSTLLSRTEAEAAGLRSSLAVAQAL